MERTYPLRQKLPAEVLVGGNAVWSRYRQYPVFGLRWLLGRSLLFCGVIAVVAAFIGMGTGVALQDLGVAIKVAITQFIAFRPDGHAGSGAGHRSASSWVAGERGSARPS